ncbi:MAG: hypothetical protein O7C59_08700 [Rickettsia endosymbiont of Ixodes persulcatus]|nr:hypothetical protein [Rickettsia endosymbiont of Ixodes persulcatus]
MLLIGPAGRVSVINGIAVVGNAAFLYFVVVREVFVWMGSICGNEFLGCGGAVVFVVTAV